MEWLGPVLQHIEVVEKDSNHPPLENPLLEKVVQNGGPFGRGL